jgi:cytochrome oxidase Cu insertion factor (SCO1/SenC/PrrC family)
VSVQQSSVPAGKPLRRLRWLLWGVSIAVGVTAGLLFELGHRSSTATPAVPGTVTPASSAAATWAAGARPAPDFSLSDQRGKPVSLARFRGRPVLLTFIDPLCRNLCPTEAKILAAVEASFPAAKRPAIVAVSVNQWGNARHVLLQDESKWKLPAEWHWAVGRPAALARVWKDYSIGVSDAPKTVTGVTVHEISHTEASYLIDAKGDQRALWLYPFRAADVTRVVRSLASAKG